MTTQTMLRLAQIGNTMLPPTHGWYIELSLNRQHETVTGFVLKDANLEIEYTFKTASFIYAYHEIIRVSKHFRRSYNQCQQKKSQ
jgi:hypothetical protein